MQTESMFDLQLDKRRQEYLAKSRELFSTYMQRPKRLKENLFLSCTGWQEPPAQKAEIFSLQEHQMLFGGNQQDKQEGGYFFSLAEKGICLNPSRNFFEYFCQQGFALQDIDVVIITCPSDGCKEALQLLHNMNRECNQTLLSYQQEPHVIRFLIHPELYAALSPALRPLFRQELNSVISLETFNKKAESLALSNNLALFYAKITNQTLALRFEEQNQNLSIGYLSGSSWNSDCDNFFESCTIMLVGVGETSPEDLEGASMLQGSLGYSGLSQMLYALPHVKLALASEFSRLMGDIRLELIKKLEKEITPAARLIALDRGFHLQLDTLVIETQSNAFAAFDDVRVIRPNGSFSQLMFLACDDVL